METKDLKASSVKEIEEAFSLAEGELFTPLYYPQRFNAEPLMALISAAQQDTRKAVLKRAETAQKRLYRYLEEVERTKKLYGAHGEEMASCDGSGVVVGLDEVGRGPLAGPVVIGAVVLDPTFYILGLNDSKKLSPHRREELAAFIQQHAKAVFLEQNTAQQIDEKGIGRAVRDAFYGAIQRMVERFGEEHIGCICIDGLPLHVHPKESAFVKGDSKIASIAAASIVAKVARDTYMKELASCYPAYGFEKNKGYGSAEHIKAIQAEGLSAVHRKTFCSHFVER